MTEVSMELHLLDTPYEILFEIFRRISKGKLIEISRLCSTFRDVAADTRLWKNINIKYVDKNGPLCGPRPLKCYGFEELYSEPWPVREIDLSFTKITPPVSPPTDQIIKVKNLDLTEIDADKVTMEAILAKYQCTELYLDCNWVDRKGRVMGMDPKAFSKQTALEVLSLRCNKRITIAWLAPILRNCKNLKILDLNDAGLKHLDMLGIAESLPASLEKLLLVNTYPQDSFFKLLSKSAPNLKELELDISKLKCPSLVKFQYLETFHFVRNFHMNINHIDIGDLYGYLIRFPALKTAYVISNRLMGYERKDIKKLRAKLIPHDIDVELVTCHLDSPYKTYPEYDDLWEVRKARARATVRAPSRISISS